MDRVEVAVHSKRVDALLNDSLWNKGMFFWFQLVLSVGNRHCVMDKHYVMNVCNSYYIFAIKISISLLRWSMEMRGFVNGGGRQR